MSPRTRNIAQDAGFDLQFFHIGFFLHFHARPDLRDREYLGVREQADGGGLQEGLEGLGHVGYRRKAAKNGLLLPLGAVAVALEHDRRRLFQEGADGINDGLVLRCALFYKRLYL